MKVDPIKNLPDRDSLDEEWISWRESLDVFGKKQANLLFIKAWKKRSDKGNFIVSGKANTERLRDYLEKRGIKIEKGIADYTVSFADEVEGFFKSALNMGKYTGIACGVVVLLIIMAVIYTLFKNPDYIVKGAAAYATGGASLAVR
jgi:hypothetical protein